MSTFSSSPSVDCFGTCEEAAVAACLSRLRAACRRLKKSVKYHHFISRFENSNMSYKMVVWQTTLESF